MSQLDLESSILTQARELRAEAHRLLFDAGLFALVEAAGPARLRGSVALDLMTWPDIDLSVQLGHDRDIETFFDLGRGIATNFPTVRMAFNNEFLRESSVAPGLYWGIYLLFGDREWKIDLWGYGADAFTADWEKFQTLQRRLATVDRLVILSIKSAVCQRPEYRKEIRSIDIYRAVLDYGVRTLEDFDRWKIESSVTAPGAIA